MPAWKRLAGGQYVDLLNFTADDVSLHDVVTALHRMRRFDGHGKLEPLVVTQHQMLVADLLKHEDAPTQLAGIIHDAHEAYIGDMGTPVKVLTGAVEPIGIKKAVRKALHPYFDLIKYRRVKLADLAALEIERKAMWEVEPGDSAYWPDEVLGISSALATRVFRWYASQTEQDYYNHYRRLYHDC